jgi:cysteine desulfurase/selenocysteine lyase
VLILKRELLFYSPYKFEAGTQNIAGVIAFKEALKYIENIGYEKYKVEKKSF